MKRLTGAKARALRLAALAEQRKRYTTGLRATVRLERSAMRLALTVEKLEAERDEARRELAANLAALCGILRPGSNGDPYETLMDAAERVAGAAEEAALQRAEVEKEIRTVLEAELERLKSELKNARGAALFWANYGSGEEEP